MPPTTTTTTTTQPLPPTLFGAAMTGLLSRIPTFPIDTLKSRIMNSPSPVSLAHTARVLYATEGIYGFWRSFFFVATSGAPASMLFFGTYDVTKSMLLASSSSSSNVPPLPPAAAHLLAGFVAETVACVLYVPIDVVKERCQVNVNNDFYSRGGYRALTHILTTEGPVRGLYKGYLQTLGSFGPFSALYFVFYERLKRALVESDAKRFGQHGEHLPFVMVASAGAAAGGGAAFLTSPLDRSKLKYQVSTTGERISMVKMLSSIYHTEGGLRGLFRGSLARVAFTAPQTAVSMATFETFKAAYNNNNNNNNN